MKNLPVNSIIKNRKIQNVINRGKLIFVKYLLIKEDEIKISNFIGLCISKRKSSNTLVLKNHVKKESIKFLIYLHSPLLVHVKILKKYKKKYRLNKLYYK